VFDVFLSSRAVPATPGERLGALAEHLPETCDLRRGFRGSTSPIRLTRLHLGLLRVTARDFAAGGLPANRHPGPASAGYLTASRRGPRYPTAQRFIGVGSFHPTRNTPLSRRTKPRPPARPDDARGDLADSIARPQTQHNQLIRNAGAAIAIAAAPWPAVRGLLLSPIARVQRIAARRLSTGADRPT